MAPKENELQSTEGFLFVFSVRSLVKTQLVGTKLCSCEA